MTCGIVVTRAPEPFFFYTPKPFLMLYWWLLIFEPLHFYTLTEMEVLWHIVCLTVLKVPRVGTQENSILYDILTYLVENLT